MANIFQQYLTPPKSVMDYSAEMDQADARRQSLQQNALTMAASRQKMDDYQRERAGDNELSRLLGAGGSPDQIATSMAQAGYGKQALAYTKQQQDLAKDRADVDLKTAQSGKAKGETEKIASDQREAKRQKAISDIAAFTDPQQALASLDLHEKTGDLAPEAAAAVRATIPQNPVDFPKWQISMLQRIMAPKDAIGQLAPDANARLSSETQQRNNDATNARIAADAAANRAQSDRQFNVREAREGSAPRGQVIQSDNGPLLVDPRTGAGKAITGPDGQPLPGVTKPLNDSQSKALLFGTRMQEANRILNTLSTEGTTTSVPGSRLPLVGGLVNAMSGENQQMLDQAKRDFINATLRRESGAAISTGEFENGEKQYFPQVGDSDKVVQQKARNRELAAKGVLIEVPEKQRNSLTPSVPPPSAPTKNAKGWLLHTDAKGNKAYVSLDGKSYEEVK